MAACRGQVRSPPLRIRHDSRLPSRRGDSSSVSSGRREWPRRCGHGSRVEVCVALSLLVRCDTRNVRPVREVVNWILRNTGDVHITIGNVFLHRGISGYSGINRKQFTKCLLWCE